jgi:hypothetical protein
MMICQIGAAVASNPSVAVGEPAPRSLCAEATMPGYAGLMSPFNCVARAAEAPGRVREVHVTGNMPGRFDVELSRHVVFSLPAGHRTEIGRLAGLRSY